MSKKKPVSIPKDDERVDIQPDLTAKEEGKVLDKVGSKEEERDREEELKAQLEAKEKEAAENYDRLLRIQAEFENYKKRIEREKVDTIRFCNENLIRELLPIVDNLEMALKHSTDSVNSESLIEGVEMVLNQFIKGLEKFGAGSFSSIGEQFDPNRHEAMMQIESDEHEANSIVSEFQKGYFLNDRLLRPAKVTVTTSPPKPSTESGNVVDEDKSESAED